MSALNYPSYKFYTEPCWQHFVRTPWISAPPPLRHWLLDRGSLTQRLMHASDGDFRVKILSQHMQRPLLSEARALRIPTCQQAIVREVILYGCNKPWVYARSVIPIKTLTGRLRRLRSLDNRPLGALLFNDRSMRRGNIEITGMKASGLIHSNSAHNAKDYIWGRRSLFFLDQKPLLVSEIFLPEFTPYNEVNLSRLELYC